MDNSELRNQVKSVMAGEWKLESDAIPDNIRLGDFSHWDSMGHVQVILALQSRFQFDMSPQIIQELVSLEKIVGWLEKNHAPA